MWFDDFDWETHSFRNFWYALTTSIVYVSFVIFHSFIYRSKAGKVLNLNVAQRVHNLILSIGSLFVFVMCLLEVLQRSSQESSAAWLLCERADTRIEGRLWFWSFVYYLSKYYELADTALQLIQGKTPPNYFLHVFHHSIVIIMCWSWISSGASMQFIGLLVNCFVHTVMYYYFYLKSLGQSPPWKSWGSVNLLCQVYTLSDLISCC
jgi:fatty acid elongase 3